MNWVLLVTDLICLLIQSKFYGQKFQPPNIRNVASLREWKHNFTHFGDWVTIIKLHENKIKLRIIN